MKKNPLLGRDVISMRDFEAAEIRAILEQCGRFAKSREPLLQGKVLANLFFEPSTRTRLSFDAAMKRLGGATIGFADALSTSISKGESLWDTIRVAEGYCDIMVIRHPAEGSARLAAEATRVPVINGGDGSNQHPTQTLLDLYTLKQRTGRIEELKIAFVGDLKYGRTVHSLIRSLSWFKAELWLVSPPSLRLPEDFLEDLRESGTRHHIVEEIAAIPDAVDVLYLTRIQKERFADAIEYERVRNAYQVNPTNVARFGPKVTLMHPLPRVNEIHAALDSHPGAAWFDQAHNGVIVRQALLALCLGAA
ncbi:MAG: aspartate carbamoyltransferase [Planctomycetes bacterium]|nr:aspartate carbamoyltransferase [Planctomycetota bacterium]